MYRIRKEFRFEAAHRLPNHGGKCRNLHGHSYRFEVFIVGERLQRIPGASNEGMLMDFGDVSAVAKEAINKLDHSYLNDSAMEFLGVQRTTAENLAKALFEFFNGRLCRETKGAYVEKVRVYETPSAWAEYSQP